MVAVKDKQNSAGRLLAIFHAVRHKQAPNKVGRDLWGSVLNVDEVAQPLGERRIASRLEAINRELDSMNEALSNMDVPEHLYGPTIRVLMEAASATTLRVNWSGNIREEHVLCLGWAQHVLPCESEVIEAAAIAEMLATVQALKQQINDAEFPGPLKSFLDKHLRIIEAALDDYSISGAIPLADAIDGLLAETIGRKTAIGEAYQSSSSQQKSALQRFADFAKSAEQIVKTAEVVGKYSMLAWDKGVHMLHWLQ
ncbi:hypothetical protein [Ralstonia flatus]|uniref:hypothetical protein n=1 Tax=Ralstonia flatus TaxID=3058601 RepID=UPI002930A2A7|nr:hypothetical protein [Ralstonia sp. LMG 32965]